MKTIRYDIDIDLKILDIIEHSQKGYTNMTELRNNTISFSPTLDLHLSLLEKWNIITDEKPSGNGKQRKIMLKQSPQFCYSVLWQLKKSIDMINYYFG